MKDLPLQSTIRVSHVHTSTSYKVWAKYDEDLKLCEWVHYAHSVTWLFLSRTVPMQSTSKFITTSLLKTKNNIVFLKTAGKTLYPWRTRNWRKGGLSF